MKIAISGKGGTGKTTLTALLAYGFAKDKSNVFVIDTDPDGNLGLTLGFSKEEVEKLKPISELKELINERTCSNGASFYKLNPTVDDIPDKYSLKKDNIRLLILGTVKKGGTGCYCPENAFMKSLLSHMLIARDEVVILDMPAGIEHLGRGTAQAVDFLIIMVEPSSKSIQTADRIKKLAKDIGIKKQYFVGNKVVDEEGLKYLYSNIEKEKFLGYISYSQDIIDSDREKMVLFNVASRSYSEAESIRKKLIELNK